MRDEVQNLRRADLDVRERLNAPERNWVIGWLVARSGVNGVLWCGAQPRLSIEYAAAVRCVGCLATIVRIEPRPAVF
jgi:hypothetical protein